MTPITSITRKLTAPVLFLALLVHATGQVGTISGPAGTAIAVTGSDPITTAGDFLLKYTYTRKCWECTYWFAMVCSESTPDCNTPTVIEEGYRQFPTAEEAIKWANDPNQGSITYISSFVPTQKPLNDFKVVALYRLQSVDIKVTVETKQIEQPAETVTLTHYGIPKP